MAVVNPPVWLDSGVYTAEADRLVTSLLVDRNFNEGGASLGIEGGVVPPLDQLNVTTNDTLFVTISSGIAVIPRKAANPPGVYLCANDNPVNVEFLPCAASQRYDILVAVVNDSQQGDVGDNWGFAVVYGTESSSPTDPALTSSMIPIARINSKAAGLNGGVDKITASQVTDLRVFVAGPGGVHVRWNNPRPMSTKGRILKETYGSFLVGEGPSSGWGTYTSDEIRTARNSQYAARQVYHDNQVSHAGNNPGVWQAIIHDETTNANMVNTISLDAPSRGGFFKVSVHAWGKCSDPAINGHMSVQVSDPSSTILASPGIARGPSFFGTFWQAAESTFILGPGVPGILHFEVEFRTDYSGGSGGSVRVYFQRVRMIVEPLGGVT